MTHWGRSDLTQPSTGVSNNRLLQAFCAVCQRKDLHKYCKLILYFIYIYYI